MSNVSWNKNQISMLLSVSSQSREQLFMLQLSYRSINRGKIEKTSLFVIMPGGTDIFQMLTGLYSFLAGDRDNS